MNHSTRRGISSPAFKPYLFAETHFERKAQPIFVLAAAEPLRRLPINGCGGLTQREKVERARKFAETHYEGCGGELMVWGDIAHYLFFYAPNRSVLIHPDGQVDESVVGMNPPKAELAGFEAH